MSSVDLTGRARIRQAALAVFAEVGTTRATMRIIAERAGVSPALLVHHFGSKEGLRAACDEHLMSFVRERKGEALAATSVMSQADYLDKHPETAVLLDYLARVVAEGGQTASQVFDALTDVLAESLADGEAAGNIQPTADPEARAVVNTALGLGILLFQADIARRLGGGSIYDADSGARYERAALELYTHGMLAGPLADAVSSRLDQELP